MQLDWIVFGVRSPLVYDIDASIRRRGDRVRGYLDNMPGDGAPEDLRPLLVPDRVAAEALACPVVVPMMTPGNRKAAVAHAREIGFSDFRPFLDPTAIVADDVEMAPGCLVNAGSVIAARCSLGPFVLVNRSASVGHHSVLEEYVSIGPGAVLCGECTVGRGAFIGAGAVLVPKIRIGANATVAAGAVVTKDVPDFAIVSGNPATVRAIRRSGYNQKTV